MAVKRVLISVPDEFLKKVDEVAKEYGFGRSEFIRQAVREYRYNYAKNNLLK